MPPTPIYTSNTIHSSAFHVRYGWTGWTSDGPFPPLPDAAFFERLDLALEADGIRRLESNWSTRQIQIICSIKPTVSPVLFVARMKGRLRQAHTPVRFRRKISFRSIGENKRRQVEAYIEKQVTKERFVDKRFSEFMQSFTTAHGSARLDQPTETGSGRYWFNLHLVLVTESRMRFTDERSLKRISEMCDKAALKKAYQLASRSVMPDHIHLALRGNIEQSPEEIALTFMNNIAFAFGQKAVFRPGYYVGTFGEYDMGAVRQ